METVPAISITGAVIPMRQAKGATMTGACLNASSRRPFLALERERPPVHAGGLVSRGPGWDRAALAAACSPRKPSVANSRVQSESMSIGII